MVALIDLWAALMVPFLFGDARFVEMRTEQTWEEARAAGREWCAYADFVELYVVITASGARIETNVESGLYAVPRGDDGELHLVALVARLGSLRQTRYFVDRADLKIAFDDAPAAGDAEDLVRVAVAARAVGLHDLRFLTSEEIAVRRRRVRNTEPGRCVFGPCY